MRAFLVLALLLALPLAVAKHASYATMSGGFDAGEPLGYTLMDACTWPALEGVNSNCRALPSGFGNHPYAVSARDGSGLLLDAAVCFYTADMLHAECDPWNQRVPVWADHVSVSALGGVAVQWRAVFQ